MSAMANITVFDGAATPVPVSHTLNPISVEKVAGETVATYRESLATIPEEAQVRVTIKLKKMGSGVWRSVVRAEVPVMENVSNQNAAGYTAAPKVAFVDTIEVIGYHNPRSTIASRRLVRQLATNLMGNIATSVAVATTGPVPELIDQLISPT